ncbi:MAG TPA: hypothetical protein DCE42_11370 [Myxococcales bacterium]|nr:hypothetical protein [Deltaproteobacteria bacterium]MBU52982.1 hypothetical protein [Deltaproteobacteria bacterium]HAA55349.1 hypothetical protein [Myxococcales bacterium]|tara:strand:- start:7196 stop:8110 length:915 start_codon:yes stop_codon:yes gene_type:complete
MNSKRDNCPISFSEPALRTLGKELITRRFSLPTGELTFSGYSRAADATGFSVPELGWVLDAGCVTHSQRPDYVFVTHTHTDHSHQLVYLKSRRKPPVICLPKEAASILERFLTASQNLTDQYTLGEPRELTRAYDLVGVDASSVFRIARGNRPIEVNVVQCDHTVPCVGYVFTEVRRKLEDAYIGLPGKEIAKLRQEGVEIMKESRFPMFAFLGDTTPLVFERHPEILEAPLVFTECSFLDKEHLDVAVRTKHTMWDDLEPIIASNPNTLFVLTHFSHRYDFAEIRAFFDAVPHKNILPWIPPQ